MDNVGEGGALQPHQGIETDGLRITVDQSVLAAALRYFDASGSFVASARALLGVEWPGVLKATAVAGSSRRAPFVLAWRSPTETLVLTTDSGRFRGLNSALAGSPDGCMVDQTGGIRVLRVSGDRVADLITRLGGTASVPGVGEARRSRMADVSVLALCVDPQETWLLVDRAYLDHLLGWIRATVADLPTR